MIEIDFVDTLDQSLQNRIVGAKAILVCVAAVVGERDNGVTVAIKGSASVAVNTIERIRSDSGENRGREDSLDDEANLFSRAQVRALDNLNLKLGCEWYDLRSDVSMIAGVGSVGGRYGST